MDEELQQRTPREESAPERDPREVVESYVPDQPREVVEYYFSSHPVIRPALSAFRGPAVPTRKRHRKGLWIALGFLVLLLLATATALVWQYYSYEEDYVPGYEYELEEGSGTVSIPTHPLSQNVQLEINTTHEDRLTPPEIYQRVNPAVVTVMAQLEDSVSIGTGVLFTDDGYLLTNFHVVEDGTSCSVGLTNGSVYEAKYVAGDKDNDIAILKMNGDHLPAAIIGDSDALAVGDPVYAIGHPLGLELRGTFTDGIVSAINRDVRVDGRNMTLVQTNAALNSGNSGGPLINQYGQVVGINTVKMISKYSTIEGLGFALPTSSIAHIINDLISTGTIQPQTALGVTVLSIAQKLPDGTWGLSVQEVSAGSGAALAGVAVGDVIVQAGGQDVTSSASLLRIRRGFHVGDTLSLRIWRDGVYMDLEVLLQEAGNTSQSVQKNASPPSDE